MKKLSDFFDTKYDVLVNDIKINSKDINPGDMFVCVKGVNVDRHEYIEDAIKNGCSCVIGSKDLTLDIPYIKVDSPDDELVRLCKINYDFDGSLKIIGVTGTDGKTTTATSIQYLIGREICGYIGTNGYCCSKFNRDIPNTTPDPTLLYKYFKEFKEAGCEYVVMEASSEGFFRRRLEGLEFDTSCYTNVTWEHVNIHGSFDNYLDSKVNLSRQTKNNFIVNFDDKYHDKFILNDNYLSYGMNPKCDLYIKDYIINDKSTDITFIYNETEYNFVSPLLGKFNVYNLACAFLTCLSMGFSMETLIENSMKISVSGRLDMIDLGQDYKVMVDYAHTPNGIVNILEFVHTLDIKRSIVVIGSAGERDYKKRPVMGKAVCDNATYAIFTYEDPRSEDPLEIIRQMVSEIEDKDKYEIVVDRSFAIKRAIDIAKKDDIVLVLGKGNETYEKLKDEVIYFNDIEECKKWILNRESETVNS